MERRLERLRIATERLRATWNLVGLTDADIAQEVGESKGETSSSSSAALADVLSLSLRGILMLGLDTSEPMVRLLAGGPTFFTTLPRLVGKDEAVLPLEPSPFLNLDLLSTSTWRSKDPWRSITSAISARSSSVAELGTAFE
mmetsp:Transcript_85/g.169  ORF Transcript_85/g.169 Transcript_85/m.169 type:complete len:142 (-) Transcript_85:317-742(-)